MKKPTSVRISFASLKTNNKENNLRFQNLKVEVQPSFNEGSSISHQRSCSTLIPINSFSTLPLLSNKHSRCENMDDICNSARFTNAIKQLGKGKAIGNKNMVALEEAYHSAQNSIRAQIQQYNDKYAEVTEMLADLHIKDLMKLNQAIEKNQMLYQSYLGYDFGFEKMPCFLDASSEALKKIYEVERIVNLIISDKDKSFDFRSTYESKDQNTVSGHSSRTSHNKKNTSLKIAKKNSETLTDMIQSIKSQAVKNSRRSKVDSLGCERRVDEALQDTPESVKSKISCTTKIRAEKNVQIGMFDRINVCESIEQMRPIQYPGEKEKRQGRPSRYGTSSQQ